MQTPTLEIPQKPQRNFLPEELDIQSWEDIQSFFIELKERTISSVLELEKWLFDRSELDAVLEEDMGWRYIKMSIETTNDVYVKNYTTFVTEIQPKIAPLEDELNKKLVDSPYFDQLDQEKYKIYLRGVKKELALFRQENVQLQADLQKESQEFGTISGAQTITYKGEEITLQKASTYLHSLDREEREQVYVMVKERRLKDIDSLNELYNRLIKKRHVVATNTGFKNYRDYMFEAMGRFDYSPQDCFDFHESIRSEIVPIIKGFQEERKEKLGFDQLRPWDMEVDTSGKPQLKPFKGGKELIDKATKAFYGIRKYYGDCLAIMNEMGHLDLESKNGKSPGGYNYPLYEIGVPFIFMNAVGTQNDLVTMVHEGGHAIHSFLTRDYEITAFKDLTSEIAELASMSMELISMDKWDEFYNSEEELKRAKRDQMERLLSILPWVAIIDKFQHWVYENPQHTVEDRTAEWVKINKEFGTGVVDWEGHEDGKEVAWQKQLHLYEVPFYYIEYGMAQLGAIAIWRNYKQDPEKALDQYQAALSLGYTKTIGEIYETAGIKFDFSQAYVKELADFVKEELAKL